jgi:hypothetical protein
VVVVEAAAAAAAPAPLAVGAVLLAAAWAAAPAVACASSSLQAVSCLGASVLSFQLRWPAAAAANPKPPPPLETAVASPTRVCACAGRRRYVARSNPLPLTERAARAWDRHCRSGAGGTVPRRQAGAGRADGCSPRRSAARRSCSAIAARRDPQRAIAACSATGAQMRCRTHLRGTFRRAAAAWPDLPSAALHETSPKGKTHQHANTNTENNAPLVPAPRSSSVRCRHSWRR